MATDKSVGLSKPIKGKFIMKLQGKVSYLSMKHSSTSRMNLEDSASDSSAVSSFMLLA